MSDITIGQALREGANAGRQLRDITRRDHTSLATQLVARQYLSHRESLIELIKSEWARYAAIPLHNLKRSRQVLQFLSGRTPERATLKVDPTQLLVGSICQWGPTIKRQKNH